MVMECVDMVYTTLSDIVGMNSVYKVQKAVTMNYTWINKHLITIKNV